MISARDLDFLFSWRAPECQSILSLYVDRKAAVGSWSPAELQTAVKGVVKDLEPRVDDADRPLLAVATEKVLALLDNGPRTGRSLVVFADVVGDGFWERNLMIPVPSQARWGPTPSLRPLLEALEEYERYGVVLTDRTRARLFTIFLGEIEEERDAFNPEPVRHVASTGTDQARTDPQRRSEAHAHHHFKRVAAMLDGMERQRRFDRLILGGPPDAPHQLRRVLPKRLVPRIGGTINLPLEAGAPEVLRETLAIERDHQRARQSEAIAELETASAKDRKAVAGLEPTLEALREGRVLKLLYSDGLSLRGRQCESCGTLFDDTVTSCRYCGGKTHPIEDLIETMAETIAGSGGRLEPVHEAAAARLGELGGIGAFLRF